MNTSQFVQLLGLFSLAGLFLLNGQPAHAELQQDSLQLTEQLTDDLEQSVQPTIPEAVPTLRPGTVATTAASLQLKPLVAQTTTPTPETTPTPAPTTPQTITPGRATRSGPSYIAVGGNIGFGGNTALGRGSFVVTSKVGLTNNFSARPGLVIGRSPTILLPVTVDFPVQSAIDGRVRVAPFVGGGIAISTRGNATVRALAMGGVDIPLSDRFTATASANAAFFSRTEIGVILGIGYNF